MSLAVKQRAKTLARLQDEKLDLLVIGGGITGAGVALQAAAAGLKTALVEMQDFAEGTSSRSTKLVHGGIRYLKTFDVGVVADTVQERAVVQAIAPHIPKPFPMMLPIYADANSTFDMFSVKIAMDIYDRLAGISADSQYANYTIDAKEVLKKQPGLRSENLLGAGVYLDYVNNDARLVIENVKEAAALGALVASRLKVEELLLNEDKQVCGAKVKDLLDQKEFNIQAKIVINTTGPWVGQFLAKNETKGPQIRPTKGVHLVIDEEKLKVPQPTYFDSGLGDGRMIFVVPREGKTYFGTTDTDYYGDYAQPKVTQEDVTYLLKALNHRYPTAKITQADIQASWVGLRPLLADNGSSDYNGGGANVGKVSDESFQALIQKAVAYEQKQAMRREVEQAISQLQTADAEKTLSPSQVSRGSALEVAKNGLVTLAGGKITDYRKMAAGALDLLRELFAQKFAIQVAEIDSKKIQVSGGHFDPTKVTETLAKYQQQAQALGIEAKEAFDLAQRYGSNTPKVLAYATKVKAAPGLTLADTLSLHYAVEEEATYTLVDFLLRRTNYLLFHSDQLLPKKEAFVNAMAELLEWTPTQLEQYRQQLDEQIAQTTLADLKV